ncbi:MAG TPA: TIGR03435 family protein [Bryobacteraceae bacterium]|nr:TIGR03435 family protein [Bryobacteraceae bacterium]
MNLKFIGIALLMTPGVAHSQTGTSTPRPEFEVATIKPSKSVGVSLQLSPGGLFETTGTSLSDLIKLAYDLHPRQIIGGPSWLETEKYDVTGKPDKPGKPDLRHLKVLVQNLLADRFQLTLRHDKMDLPVYAITVAKSGPRLTTNDSDPNGLPTFSVGPRELRFRNATMAEFASILQGVGRIFDRPLADQTGLGSARYDFILKWTPDAPPSQTGRAEPVVDNAEAPPGLFTAFQEQLGLKLESTKAPVEVLVIEHVERPSEN